MFCMLVSNDNLTEKFHHVLTARLICNTPGCSGVMSTTGGDEREAVRGRGGRSRSLSHPELCLPWSGDTVQWSRGKQNMTSD